MTHDTITYLNPVRKRIGRKSITHRISYQRLKHEEKLLEGRERGEVDCGKPGNCHRRDAVEEAVNIGDVVVTI